MIGRVPAGAVALLVLAACSGGKDAASSERDATAAVAEAPGVAVPPASPPGSSSTERATVPGWPADVPDYVAPYPGARVVEAAASEQTAAVTGLPLEGQAGGIVNLRTDDAPAAVTRFYAERTRAAGMERMSEMSVGGQHIFSAGDRANNRSLMVHASEQDGSTNVMLT